MQIAELQVTEREIELRAPFVTALRSVSGYPVIEVRCLLADGRIGIGDCVATPAITGDSREAILADLNSSVFTELRSRQYQNQSELHAAIAASRLLPSARAALDIALFDACSPIRSVKVASDVTIPICTDDEFEEIFAQRRAAGFTAFKVKVDRAGAATLPARVAQIAAAGSFLIRIDPNQAWDLELALSVMREIEGVGIAIEYLEQPLPRADLAGHAALAAKISTPLMADESVFSLDDLEGIAEDKIFTWLNVKLLKSGGYVPAQELVARATEIGMRVSIGSMMEGERGIRAAAQLAYEIAPTAHHDLDAAWWFRNTAISYAESILST